MAQRVPRVVADALHIQASPKERVIPLDSAEWFAWLEEPVNRSFDLCHPLGRLTVRKERRQRGSEYWAAYRRAGGRLRKVYLGKSPRLTLARLGQAAAQIAVDVAATLAEETTMTVPVSALDGINTSGPLDVAADTGAAVLLSTKLGVPPLRPRLVRRPRLTGWLTRHAGAALLLVVAPPGFGKTTLLAEWCATLAGHKRDTAWVSLDASDDDPTRFWGYVVAALRSAHVPLPDDQLTPLAVPHASTSTAIFAVAGLINALSGAALARDITLVLDDYHLITARAIHEGVAFLLDHMPQHLHLIVSARAAPPLALDRPRARGMLAELPAADLCCTRDEVEAFVRRVMGLRLAPEAIDLLAERTEGWLAGIQLTVLSLRGRAESAPMIAARLAGAQDVEPYFAAEVLARQPAEIQRFLLDTSVLETLNAPLCDAITGRSDGEAMLRRLMDAQVFLIPLDAESRWYRYHHLCAQVFRARLRREVPERANALYRRASEWHERHGTAAEAISYALVSGDTDRAAGLIETTALPAIWERGEVALVRAWLDALPAALRESRPRLALAYAHTAVAARDLSTAERLVRGVVDAGGREASSRLAAELAYLRTRIRCDSGDLDGDAALVREALGAIPTSAPLWRAALTTELGHTHHLAGDLAAAERAYEAAARLARQGGKDGLAAYATGCLALIYVEAGRLHDAARCCRDAIQPEGRASDVADAPAAALLPHAALACHLLAEVLYEWDALDDALRYARQAAALAERGGDMVHAIAVDGLLARLHLAQGDLERARAVVVGSDTLAAPAPALTVTRWKTVVRARWQLATGDVAAAAAWEHAWITRLGAVEADADMRLPALERETIVRLRLAQGRYAEAAELAARERAAAEARGAGGRAIVLLALEALAWQSVSDADRALAAIERALKLTEPEGYTRLFVDLGAPMEALLRRAAAYGVMPGAARRLLAALRMRPDARPTDRELAVLRLVAAGLSNQAIADHLVIAESTVKTHLRRVYAKLGAANRAHAITLAREGKLL